MNVSGRALGSILLVGMMSACGPKIIDVPYQSVSVQLWGPNVPDESVANPFFKEVTQQYQVTISYFEDAAGEVPYGRSLGGDIPREFGDFQPVTTVNFSGARFNQPSAPAFHLEPEAMLPRLHEDQKEIFVRVEVLGLDRNNEPIARARCPVLKLAPQTEATGAAECRAFYGFIGRWNAVAPPRVPRHSFAAAALPDGRVVIAGGLPHNAGPESSATLSSVEIFNPATRSWSDAANGLTRARSDLTGTTTQRGEVIFAGGRAGSSYSDAWEVFDPQTTQVKNFDSKLNSPRAFHGAALFGRDAVVLAGGQRSAMGQVNEVERLNASGSVVQRGSAGGRPNPCLVRVRDNRLLICGGARTCATYDGNDFVEGGAMTVERDRPRCGAVDGSVFIVGGGATPAQGRAIDVWRNGNITAWSGGEAPESLIHHAVAVANGKVVVSGGYVHTTTTPSMPRSETFWLDPATETLHPAGNMNIGRARHRMVPLTDGTILAIGGMSDPDDTRAPGAEIFVVPD